MYYYINAMRNEREKGDKMRNADETLRIILGDDYAPKQAPRKKASKADLAIQIYREAREAGERAMRAAKPTPMIVSDADLAGNPIPGGKSWYVPSGICGFAWIKIKGNSWFIRELKKAGLASAKKDWNRPRIPFEKDSYSGGYSYWISEGGQSMELKEAYANAFADVLEAYGISAYAGSRMD